MSAAPRTFRKTLTLSHTLLLAASVLVLSLGVYWLVQRYLVRSGAARLFHGAQEAIESSSSPPRRRRPRSPVPVQKKRRLKGRRVVEQAAPVGGFAVLYDQRGQALTKRLGRAELLDLERMPEHQVLRPFYLFDGERHWQAMLVPVEASNEVLLVGSWWDPSRSLLRTLALYELGAGLVILLIGWVASWRLAARLALPVERFSQAARKVASGDLTVRLPKTEGEGEFERMGRTFNQMVARLEESFEAQRRFVGDASHELKTPLTSITGMAEMLRRGAADDPADRALALATIENEVDRMNGLISDLLALSRAEHQESRPEPMDLAELLREFAPEVELEGPERLEIDADPKAVYRVVRNLVDNAVKYSPPDQDVWIRTRRVENKVELVVEDQGIGMNEQEVARAFERFYRADPARARDTGGSGLGLSIVAALMESLGGSVTLHSQPGQGTRAVCLFKGSESCPSAGSESGEGWENRD